MVRNGEKKFTVVNVISIYTHVFNVSRLNGLYSIIWFIYRASGVQFFKIEKEPPRTLSNFNRPRIENYDGNW